MHPTHTTEARLIRRAERRAKKRHRATVEERRLTALLDDTYGDRREAGPYQPRHRAGGTR
jgi:hypothetical protein